MDDVQEELGFFGNFRLLNFKLVEQRSVHRASFTLLCPVSHSHSYVCYWKFQKVKEQLRNT